MVTVLDIEESQHVYVSFAYQGTMCLVIGAEGGGGGRLGQRWKLEKGSWVRGQSIQSTGLVPVWRDVHILA